MPQKPQGKIQVTKPFDEAVELTREDLVRVVERYVGVPYRAQGRDRRGLDCGGLALVVGRETGYTDLEVLGYSDRPDGESFEALLNMTCVEIDPRETLPGDIFACDYGGGIQHTGFVVAVTPDPARKFGLRMMVVHAKAPRTDFGTRDRGVVRQRLHGYDERGWVKTYRLRIFA